MRSGWLLLLVLILLLAILIPSVTAHGTGKIEAAMNLSGCGNASDMVQCYLALCGSGYDCAASVILSVTESGGASAGMQTLAVLMDSRSFGITSDGHELAHLVGREVARHSGLTAEAFLSCPVEYNYGCQHGFFEAALADAASPSEAARRICENLPGNRPGKDKFYCYHGIGHGVMMAAAYDLNHSLSLCDSLPNSLAAESCWQGVFMENVNGVMGGEVEAFDNANPLAPCSRIPEQYQWQCYINHAAYLMRFYNNSLRHSAAACLNASPHVVSACMQSLALMTTNPAWQLVMARDAKVEGNNSIEIALGLCGKFPASHRQDCIFGAVDNLLNFQAYGDAVGFCSGLSGGDRQVCATRFGAGLRGVLVSAESVGYLCAELPQDLVDNCMNPSAAMDDGYALFLLERQVQPLVLAQEKQSDVVAEAAPESRGVAVAVARFMYVLSSPARAAAGALKAGIGLWARARHDEGSASLPPLEDSSLILSDDAFVEDLMKKYGLEGAVESLRRVAESNGVDCHNRAHEVGRIAYDIRGSVAFKECGVGCHSGCLHGAMEAFFAEEGTANMESSLSLLCSEELNGFFAHQCLHGVGHGLMAWTDYDLPEALAACDQLSTPSAQSSCHTGVFMENIVGGLGESQGGHDSAWLSNDSHFPCNAVDEKYKSSCYFLQTSRMVAMFSGNFTKVAEECAKAPAYYSSACFESMGRDVSGTFSRNASRAIAACELVEQFGNAKDCVHGALQDQFWDKSQAGNAVSFCDLLKSGRFANNSNSCYMEVIGRAADVIRTDSGMSEFCAGLPENFRAPCAAAKPSGSAEYLQAGAEGGEVDKTPRLLPNASRQGVLGQVGAVSVYDGEQFNPSKMTIQKGQAVTFVNDGSESFWPASNIHPTHMIYPEFDAGKPLPVGSNWSFIFQKSGTWRFHDHMNPRAAGSITVEE